MRENEQGLPGQWFCRSGCRVLYLTLTGYLALLLFLSLNPWVRPKTTAALLSPDKLAHALAYAILAIGIFLALPCTSERFHHCRRCAWLMALAISVTAGIGVEIAQSVLTVNRTGSPEDAVANAIGVMLGLSLFQGMRFAFAKH
jgi:VanZ family protein